LAAIYGGAARSEAAKMAGVTLQIVRDWVVWFNAWGAGRRSSTTRNVISRITDLRQQDVTA
jgi:transposase